VILQIKNTFFSLLRWISLPVGLCVLYAIYLRGGELFDSQYFKAQCYDAAYYYDLSQSFRDAHGNFDLLSFKNSLRGYLWPLILSIFYPSNGWNAGTHPATTITAFRPLGVALAAALFGVGGPLLWARLHGTMPSILRQAVFAALGFVFWRDYFHYSLADMPGVLALMLALALVLGRKPTLGSAAAGGAFAGAAAIIRPVFVLGWAAVIFGAVIIWVRDSAMPISRRLALLGALFLGTAVTLVPQWGINERHYNQNSPFVLGWRDPANPRSLYIEQLSWGLQMQKYETSVDPNSPAQMIYSDPSGIAIRRSVGLTNLEDTFPSFGAYLSSAIDYFPDLALVYARHLFNSLDIRQPTPYLRPFNRWAICLAVVVLFKPPILNKSRVVVLLTAVLLPCAAVLPTAIEVRFMLPIHLLMYGIVAFGWPADWTIKHIAQLPRLRALLVAYGCFVLGCFMLSSSAHVQLTGWVPLLAP
jgi:hypothetical protein